MTIYQQILSNRRRNYDRITVGHISSFLDSADLKVRPSNQCRAMLADLFDYAVAKGKCPDNPAAATIPRLESKARHRHTLEGLMLIRDASPAFLRNAIDLALTTAQRRGDIVAMRFSHIKDGRLEVVQEASTSPRCDRASRIAASRQSAEAEYSIAAICLPAASDASTNLTASPYLTVH